MFFQAPKPAAGPHKSRECLPLVILLRNRLNYALTAREVKIILMERKVKVDGKVRVEPRFPCGFMDVVSIPETNEHFRLLYNVKGRFHILRIKDDEATVCQYFVSCVRSCSLSFSTSLVW
jgi:small subunit ribosomal protein S4e